MVMVPKEAEPNTSTATASAPAAVPAAPRKRGFAALSSDAVRQLGQKGGKEAQARGTANRFSPQQAQAAGKKGGDTTRSRRETKVPAGPT